jgi:hypothetical protein
MGYDASVGEYCNMIEKGILDPLKVVSSRILRVFHGPRTDPLRDRSERRSLMPAVSHPC